MSDYKISSQCPIPEELLPEEKTLFSLQLNFQNNVRFIQQEPSIKALIIKYFEASQMNKYKKEPPLAFSEYYMIYQEYNFFSLIDMVVDKNFRTQEQMEKDRVSMGDVTAEVNTYAYVFAYILDAGNAGNCYMDRKWRIETDYFERTLLTEFVQFVACLLCERDLIYFREHMITFTLYCNRGKKDTDISRDGVYDSTYLDKIVNYADFYEEYKRKYNDENYMDE